ncbi:hypothetical protein V5799_004998, partial [Amblyomma americanum]
MAEGGNGGTSGIEATRSFSMDILSFEPPVFLWHEVCCAFSRFATESRPSRNFYPRGQTNYKALKSSIFCLYRQNPISLRWIITKLFNVLSKHLPPQASRGEADVY